MLENICVAETFPAAVTVTVAVGTQSSNVTSLLHRQDFDDKEVVDEPLTIRRSFWQLRILFHQCSRFR
jgi:hypothetical protein